jgi:protein involved in ribonucleotide reduction
VLIAFDSRTGNVKRFVAKLDMNCIQISENLFVKEPFVLITYTTGFGEIPKLTTAFLSNNHTNLIAVSSSGNKNWGAKYGRSADVIAAQYNVPIISKFELSGTQNDVAAFREGIRIYVKVD